MWKEEKEIVPFGQKLWLSSPTMHGPELEYMTEAFRTNWMSTVGKNISEVEHLTCEKVGCGHAVALASGTAALHMAVKLAAAGMNTVHANAGMIFLDAITETLHDAMEPEA